MAFRLRLTATASGAHKRAVKSDSQGLSAKEQCGENFSITDFNNRTQHYFVRSDGNNISFGKMYLETKGLISGHPEATFWIGIQAIALLKTLRQTVRRCRFSPRRDSLFGILLLLQDWRQLSSADDFIAVTTRGRQT